MCGDDRLTDSLMTLDKLVVKINERLAEQRNKPSEIRLIGRADSQPINNDEFDQTAVSPKPVRTGCGRN